jgi:hypothetical protein
LENSPKAGKKVRKLRREHNNRQIGQEKEIWTVGFTSKREAGGVHKKGRSEPSDLDQNTRQPLDLIGVARGLSFTNRRLKVRGNQRVKVLKERIGILSGYRLINPVIRSARWWSCLTASSGIRA